MVDLPGCVIRVMVAPQTAGRGSRTGAGARIYSVKQPDHPFGQECQALGTGECDVATAQEQIGMEALGKCTQINVAGTQIRGQEPHTTANVRAGTERQHRVFESQHRADRDPCVTAMQIGRTHHVMHAYSFILRGHVVLTGTMQGLSHGGNKPIQTRQCYQLPHSAQLHAHIRGGEDTRLHRRQGQMRAILGSGHAGKHG